MKIRILCLLLLLGVAAAAQHQHPAASTAGEKSATVNHHAFLDAERAAIERGEGFGMALAADRNGYPGPRHVLEWKKELQLTPQQESAMQKLFDEMRAKAVARGKEVLAAEARLEKYFAEGRTEDELREETFRVSTLRAELRWIHLSTHLAAKKLLSPSQVQAYMKLRHGQ
ncbi:MAG TPA: hypothetical protein VNL38_01865 [Candidatus Nitrosotenuis sp.]|nr:hypothetical protein [Candidatus Nitrosotenuis sp.]